jgi:hypothetical protein
MITIFLFLFLVVGWGRGGEIFLCSLFFFPHAFFIYCYLAWHGMASVIVHRRPIFQLAFFYLLLILYAYMF